MTRESLTAASPSSNFQRFRTSSHFLVSLTRSKRFQEKTRVKIVNDTFGEWKEGKPSTFSARLTISRREKTKFRRSYLSFFKVQVFLLVCIFLWAKINAWRGICEPFDGELGFFVRERRDRSRFVIPIADYRFSAIGSREP